MATLILTAVGTAVGGPVGGAVGAILGQAVDARLLGPKPRQGPRLGDLAVQTSSYGTQIPKVFGTMRVAGTVIWSTDLIERRATTGGGKGRPGTVNYTYSASFAVALSARPAQAVRRIWADGKLLRGEAGDFKAKTSFRFHAGDEDQAPDPAIVAAEGAGQAPAFRGLCYAVFEDLELADYGNRIPSLTFELVADAGPMPPTTIAAELAGLSEGATGQPVLIGFAASGDSVRGALEDLSEAFSLAYIDDGADFSVSPPALSVRTFDPGCEIGRRELVRRADTLVPGDVTIAYHDAARDYQTSLQRADRGNSAALSERRALPAVMDAAAAKALAEVHLDRAVADRVGATVTCSWAGADLKPGTHLTLNGETGRWRVVRWTLGRQQVTLELRRVAAAPTAPAGAASAGRARAEADLVQGTTVLRLLDLPLDDGLVAVAAGAMPGWRRATLSVSFDEGASWSDLGQTAAPGIIGVSETVLPPAASTLFDMTGSVDVLLLHDEMHLLGASDDALVNGANLALLGDELIQFGVAERIAPRRWRLSRLLRGRRGTEWASDGQVTGEPFTLIEHESCRVISLPAGLGDGASVRVVASGAGDTIPLESGVVLTRPGLRPPSPVHLAVEPLASGDIRIAWVRRSRVGWAWTSGGDTLLGEEREAYRLTFTGSLGARSIDVGGSDYLYGAQDRALDGAGPVELSVCQIGDHGLSPAATILIPRPAGAST